MSRVYRSGLVRAEFKKQGGSYERVFNVHNVVYIDPLGVMFVEGEHALFSEGQYSLVLDQLVSQGLLP